MHIQGNLEGCPRCGGAVRWPEGTFDFDEFGNATRAMTQKEVETAAETMDKERFKRQITTFIDRPLFTDEILLKLQMELEALTQQVSQQSITIEEVTARTTAISPELTGLLKFAPKNASDLAAYLTLFLSVIIFILSQREQEKPPVVVNNTYNTYISAPTPNPAKKNPPSAGKADLDVLCQCDSGLKFMECHGRNTPPISKEEHKNK